MSESNRTCSHSQHSQSQALLRGHGHTSYADPCPTKTLSRTPVNVNNGSGDMVKGESPLKLRPAAALAALETAEVTDDLNNAVDTLIHLYRIFGSSINSEELKTFVNFFCEKMVKVSPPTPTSPGVEGRGSIVQADSFSCPLCYAIFITPITISCGHTYCKKCLEKEKVGKSCRRCKHILTQKDICGTGVNVLIQSLVEKWWSSYFEAAKLRSEGNALFEKKLGEEALKKYSAAIAICKFF